MTEPIDLSEREQQVAALVASALPNKQIATELGISCTRVKAIITSVAFKIGADPSRSDRVQVAVWWVQQPTPDPLGVAQRHSA